MDCSGGKSSRRSQVRAAQAPMSQVGLCHVSTTESRKRTQTWAVNIALSPSLLFFDRHTHTKARIEGDTMSPIRGHLLLLGITSAVCAGSFVLNFLYVRQGSKGGEL